MSEKELPELPRGWEWRDGTSGPFAYKDGASVRVSGCYVHIADYEETDEFVIGCDIIIAVLKANGVEL